MLVFNSVSVFVFIQSSYDKMVLKTYSARFPRGGQARPLLACPALRNTARSVVPPSGGIWIGPHDAQLRQAKLCGVLRYLTDL